jgi:hypothetical protein
MAAIAEGLPTVFDGAGLFLCMVAWVEFLPRSTSAGLAVAAGKISGREGTGHGMSV